MAKFSNNDRLVFSKTKIEMLLGNYSHSISIIGSSIIILLSIIAVGGFGNINMPGMKVIFMCCGFLIIGSFLIKIQKKGFVCFLEIHPSKGTINFEMFSGELIHFRFEQIEKIKVNGYAFFNLNEKTVVYNDLTNRLLFETINKIKKIEWGEQCSIWGPPKELRNLLDREHEMKGG